MPLWKAQLDDFVTKNRRYPTWSELSVLLKTSVEYLKWHIGDHPNPEYRLDKEKIDYATKQQAMKT